MWSAQGPQPTPRVPCGRGSPLGAIPRGSRGWVRSPVWAIPGSRHRPVGDLSGRDSAGSLQQQDRQPREGAPWSWSVIWAPYREGPHCALGQATHHPVVETLLRESSEILRFPSLLAGISAGPGTTRCLVTQTLLPERDSGCRVWLLNIRGRQGGAKWTQVDPLGTHIVPPSPLCAPAQLFLTIQANDPARMHWLWE